MYYPEDSSSAFSGTNVSRTKRSLKQHEYKVVVLSVSPTLSAFVFRLRIRPLAMAELISLIASIITVLGTADSALKTLSVIKSFRKAPTELLALQNEIADLSVVLNDVESSLSRDAEMPPGSPGQIQHLAKLIIQAKTQLLELDKVVHYKIILRGAPNHGLEMSRMGWIKAKPILEGIRQGLREVRHNIMTQMMVLSSYVSGLIYYQDTMTDHLSEYP